MLRFEGNSRPRPPFFSPCESMLLIRWDHVLCFICWSVWPRWAAGSSKCSISLVLLYRWLCVMHLLNITRLVVKLSRQTLSFCWCAKAFAAPNRTAVLSKCLKCFCMTFYYSVGWGRGVEYVNATSTVVTCEIDAIFLENIFDGWVRSPLHLSATQSTFCCVFTSMHVYCSAHVAP